MRGGASAAAAAVAALSDVERWGVVEGVVRGLVNEVESREHAEQCAVLQGALAEAYGRVAELQAENAILAGEREEFAARVNALEVFRQAQAREIGRLVRRVEVLEQEQAAARWRAPGEEEGGDDVSDAASSGRAGVADSGSVASEALGTGSAAPSRTERESGRERGERSGSGWAPASPPRKESGGGVGALGALGDMSDGMVSEEVRVAALLGRIRTLEARCEDLRLRYETVASVRKFLTERIDRQTKEWERAKEASAKAEKRALELELAALQADALVVSGSVDRASAQERASLALATASRAMRANHWLTQRVGELESQLVLTQISRRPLIPLSTLSSSTSSSAPFSPSAASPPVSPPHHQSLHGQNLHGGAEPRHAAAHALVGGGGGGGGGERGRATTEHRLPQHLSPPLSPPQRTRTSRRTERSLPSQPPTADRPARPTTTTTTTAATAAPTPSSPGLSAAAGAEPPPSLQEAGRVKSGILRFLSTKRLRRPDVQEVPIGTSTRL
jgi:hypothetical protein